MNFRLALRSFLLAASALTASAAGLTWASLATGGPVSLSILEPTAKPATATPPVVFYLENLAAPRVGTDSDAIIVADLRAAGNLVVTLDYAHHPLARWPHLNTDLIQLREQLQKKTLLAGRTLDAAHIFILPSGHRLKRDVVFYREANRTLAMDVIYPSHPAKPVGAVLEFSCDNENRMGNFSLNFCTDTLLEGSATEGFAVAMADHPVAAPYKGFDAMPDCAWKIHAAVRTLRAEGAALGFNGRIVPVGFSRGSGMALMLVTTGGRPEFEGRGEAAKASSAVQGAVVLSGRFTYLDLLPDDHMIPRYIRTWGERAAHLDTWRTHGALDYLKAPAPVPLFLSINRTESPDALHQMDVLRHRLAELRSPFEYQIEEQPRGHRVPVDTALLDAINAYLHRQLE